MLDKDFQIERELGEALRALNHLCDRLDINVDDDDTESEDGRDND